MRILHEHAASDRLAQTLVILLPGALQPPEQFLRSGFADAVRARGLPLDLAMPDLAMRHIGETIDGSAQRRLHDDVVQPARRQGYRAIWLAGISIGGMMAVAYAECHPGDIDGLCLLAPYPGNRLLTKRIRASGGLAQWRPDDAADDAESRMWQWLKTHRRQPDAPIIHLGYGRQDRFADGQEMMAEALDPASVDLIDGGHDWSAWRRLWDNFLDRLAARAAFSAERRT